MVFRYYNNVPGARLGQFCTVDGGDRFSTADFSSLADAPETDDNN